MQHLQVVNNEVKTMSSLEIADLTGKRHADVMRDIRVIIDQMDNANLRFLAKSTTYTADNGIQYPCYELDKESSTIIVTGYDVIARAKVVKRWLELEEVAFNTRNIMLLEQIRDDTDLIKQLNKDLTAELKKAPMPSNKPVVNKTQYRGSVPANKRKHVPPVFVETPTTPTLMMTKPVVYRGMEYLVKTTGISEKNIDWVLYDRLFTDYSGEPLEEAAGYYNIVRVDVLWSVEFIVKLLIAQGWSQFMDKRIVDCFK